MLKRLLFADTPAARALFEQLWDGVVLGSQPADRPLPVAKPRAQTRREADLQRVLMAVSAPSATVDRNLRPANARSLNPDVRWIDLTVEQVTLAGELVEKVPWGGTQQVVVSDLYDLLEGASFAPTETKEDPRG